MFNTVYTRINIDLYSNKKQTLRIMEDQTIKVKITIIAEVSSAGDREVSDILSELEQNSLYEIPSTENVEVQSTEWQETELIEE